MCCRKVLLFAVNNHLSKYTTITRVKYQSKKKSVLKKKTQFSKVSVTVEE